jgi:hypothetical protein
MKIVPLVIGLPSIAWGFSGSDKGRGYCRDRTKRFLSVSARALLP